MRKMLWVLIAVLLVGTAFASVAMSAGRVEVAEVHVTEPVLNAPASILNNDVMLPDLFQGGGAQGLNMCRIQCRIAYIDCQEIFCPAPTDPTTECPYCDSEYQACLANC